MTERPTWLSAANVYTDRRVIAVLFLGFSSGMPLLLTLSTLSIWLAESGVSKTQIGLFALVGLPYSIKFLWAPLIDRLYLPVLTPLLGRRRGWAVLTQFMLMAGIVGMGTSDPATDPWTTAAWALFVAFGSASQDVVIDAYRVEVLDERRYAAGAAMIVAGYRLGMLASGAGALYLAEAMSWFWVYVAMAALVLVGVITILINPEPSAPSSTGPEIATTAPVGTRIVAWLNEAVVGPLADFLHRPGWLAILLFVLLYKFGDSLAGVMANPFYVEIGFTKGEIASVSKIFGLGATLVGGFLGGITVARLGIMHSLLICGLLQMLSNLMFAVQAVVGASVPMLAVTIAVENVAGGMGTAAFVAYLSGLCNIAYTATQYALLSSFMAFARTALSSPGGWLAESTDWVTFFVLTTVAAIPGLLLWWWLMRRGTVPGTDSGRRGKPAMTTAVEIIEADITTLTVDAIVNAANEGLHRGGGVCGAIHRAAGPELEAECLAVGHCPTGEARITAGYLLPAKHVIHAVGPVWHGGGAGEADLLASCYRACFRLADDNGLTSIALPAISTGIFGFPLDAATAIALREARRYVDAGCGTLRRIVFCTFGADVTAAYRAAYARQFA